jgi:hypothetical protein
VLTTTSAAMAHAIQTVAAPRSGAGLEASSVHTIRSPAGLKHAVGSHVDPRQHAAERFRDLAGAP